MVIVIGLKYLLQVFFLNDVLATRQYWRSEEGLRCGRGNNWQQNFGFTMDRINTSTYIINHALFSDKILR